MNRLRLCRAQRRLCQRWMSAEASSESTALVANNASETALADAKRLEQREADEQAVREGRINVEIATRLLLNPSPRRRHFGLDWHLWQFFCALIPPFLVYQVAMYARRDIERIEKERGIAPLKKKQWSRRHEHYREQREFVAKKMLMQAGISPDDFTSLKDRLNVVEDKLDAIQKQQQQPAPASGTPAQPAPGPATA